MLEQLKLTYVIRDNVLLVTTESDSKGKMQAVTHPVGDLVIAPINPVVRPMTTLEELLNHRPQGYQYGGPMPFSHTGMMHGGSLAGVQHPMPGGGFAHGHPGMANPTGNSPASINGNGGWTIGSPGKQTMDDQLISLITSTIEPKSWDKLGGQGTIQYFPLGMGLIVNQTQDIQEQIVDLLQALRRLQDLEVAIEIRLVSVSESFYEFIGLDFDINITTDQGRFEPQLITNQFQPFGFVNRFLPDGFVSGLTPAGTFTPDLNIPLKNSSFAFSPPPFGLGGFPGMFGANGGLALGLAFLSDIQVFMFLEAAQADKRANAMQAPRVTVFNGQFANLTVQDNLPVLLNVNVDNPINPSFFIPQQTVVPLGTSIFVQPVVTADRRFVRLGIQQTMQNLISANVPLIPINVPPPPIQVTDNVFGGAPNTQQPKLFQIFLQQPTTSSINVTTTVTVPDGGTVLLGGLKTLTEARNEAGPPVLSKIPYINRLFKNVGYGREATSLLMMVTPRIIINEEEELLYLGQSDVVIPRP
jgi:type II secretory pathway component GspD/PulD (secretin)